MHCCGVNSSADWRNFTPDGNSVPDSCCLNVTTSCGLNAMLDASKVYQKVKPAALVVTLRCLFVCVCVLKSSPSPPPNPKPQRTRLKTQCVKWSIESTDAANAQTVNMKAGCCGLMVSSVTGGGSAGEGSTFRTLKRTKRQN